MQIRHVLIKNFRGIKQLEWAIYSPIVCLIGAGDSTKSTVLDAIEYALSPRWNLTFEDCDFYSGNTDHPIEIIVTVGQIPDELFKQEKFGLLMRAGVHNTKFMTNPKMVMSMSCQLDSK